MERFVIVFVALFAITTLYAMILNLSSVQNWYVPKYTWLTVVIGNALIGLSILALCLLGELPLRAFWLLFIANVAAGVPIVYWQLHQNAQRHQALKTNH